MYDTVSFVLSTAIISFYRCGLDSLQFMFENPEALVAFVNASG